MYFQIVRSRICPSRIFTGPDIQWTVDISREFQWAENDSSGMTGSFRRFVSAIRSGSAREVLSQACLPALGCLSCIDFTLAHFH